LTEQSAYPELLDFAFFVILEFIHILLEASLSRPADALFLLGHLTAFLEFFYGFFATSISFPICIPRIEETDARICVDLPSKRCCHSAALQTNFSLVLLDLEFARCSIPRSRPVSVL